MKEQKKVLDRLAKRYGKFKVAMMTTYGSWSYFNYPSDNGKYHCLNDDLKDRQIMHDEIVIESDLSMRKMNRGVSERIEKRLLRKNIEYSKWFSGGKSYHIHLTMPELLKFSGEDLKLLKRLFVLWLYDFDIQEVYRHKIDLQLCGTHMIKLEYSPHSETNIRKQLISENDSDKQNKIPEIIWSKFKQEKEYVPNKNFKPQSFDDKECLKYFTKNKVSDGKQRIAFILFNNYKMSYGIEAATDFIKNWNAEINKYAIPEVKLNGIIRSGKLNERYPGCRYVGDIIGELGLDLCKDCPGRR